MAGDIVIISALYPAEKQTYDLTKFLDLGTTFYIFGVMVIFSLVTLVYVDAESKIFAGGGHENAIPMFVCYDNN